MKQIASELNIHISTVSRALKNKYLHSVQGTVPLSLFFSQPATQKSQTGLGGRAVQAVLQELIAAEDIQSFGNIRI
jgi:RNA polymerase sigma-54 factor